MKIDKDTIIAFLKQHGDGARASEAAKELPDRVDTDEHRGLLSKYGIDVDDLLAKLPGGLGEKLDKLPGGLGKKLDDLL
jgi:hypothetical protein